MHNSQWCAPIDSANVKDSYRTVLPPSSERLHSARLPPPLLCLLASSLPLLPKNVLG
jgi:hypothetical protein